MTEYRGMPAVKAMAEEFKNRVAALKEKGIYPKLAFRCGRGRGRGHKASVRY